MIIRALAFLGVFYLALFTSFPFYALGVLAYALYWQGIELFIIGAYIDITFGGLSGGVGFTYTLVVGSILIGTTLLKPYIRFYDEHT